MLPSIAAAQLYDMIDLSIPIRNGRLWSLAGPWNALEPAWSVIAGCHRAQPTRVSGQLCGLESTQVDWSRGEGQLWIRRLAKRCWTRLPRRPPGPSADNDIWAVVWIGIDTS